MNDTWKTVVDGAAAGTSIAAVCKLLPPLAALMTIIWTGIRIYAWIRGKKVD